jgi:dihydroxyacetone kinase phosphoprotein-dependent L subunit
MADHVGPAVFKDLLLKVADRIIGDQDELSRLDSVIGDGDHGVGMGHGFAKAKERLAAESHEGGLDKLARTFGLGVVSGAGGASGPLFGGLFTEGAKVLKGLDGLDAEGAKRWWRAALEATMARGGAKPGDKTMVDALHPAVEAMEAHEGGDLASMLASAAKAAWTGVERTKDYVAAQGRSRYAGERAIGHQDAGATSVAKILETLAEALASKS